MERYYSANVLRWPLVPMVRCFWRLNPLVVILAFPFVLLRKLPGLRPAVTYGIRYPDELTLVDWENIPAYARTPLEARKQECAALGFGDAICVQPQSIGQYEHYDVILLHETGTEFVLLRWFRVNNAGSRAQNCQVHCSSVLASGGMLSSSALARNEYFPELALEDMQRRVYPETTSIADLIGYHREGIPAGAKLREFDFLSYPEFLLARTQQLVDTMLEKKLFFELTSGQIQSLQETSPA
jgi:hypothetical protein